MCGIAGELRWDGAPASPRLLEAMIAQLRHRGPDATGLVTDGPAGLAHARLSVIDLEHGRQPMATADGRLVLSFNGELYNYVELRDELIRCGRVFRTRSDTEVALQAFAQWGEACVARFNGQWALALWDAHRGRLLLSRDRFGVRPLFFAFAGRRFLFASEVKALFACRSLPREFDPAGLAQVFTFWCPVAPRTVFRGVSQLPPACNMLIEGDGRTVVRPYWRLEFSDEFRKRDSRRLADELRQLLLDATRIRLRADVPVGAYVSGGLDSAVTAALARRCGARLRTFSLRFEQDEFDEGRYQQLVIERLESSHRSVRCGAEDIARALPLAVWRAEQPLLRTAPAPMLLLSRLVRQEGLKVVLTGEGADEVLGGYNVFKEAKVRRFWARQPDSPRRAALLKRLYPYLPAVQAQPLAFRKAFFRASAEDLASPLFSHLPRWRLTAQLQRLFLPEWRAAFHAADVLGRLEAQLPSEFPTWPPFCQAQYLEIAVLLPGYILAAQGDRAAMAHAVEGRFPFLDHRLAEWAARLPPRLKMCGLDEKHLLKRALAPWLPHAVVRRPKQPYRAPDALSLFDPARGGASRLPYVDELLAPAALRRHGLVEPAAVARLVAKAREGRLLGVRDNMALVGALTCQLLAEQLAAGPAPAAAPVAAAPRSPAPASDQTAPS